MHLPDDGDAFSLPGQDGTMQVRGIGMMECWNDGILGRECRHCSIIPIFQYSSIPTSPTSSCHFAQKLTGNGLVSYSKAPKDFGNIEAKSL